jgi:lipoprotein-releasing system permease protein
VGVVALAALLGLMLGVAALVISLALLAGFQAHVRARLAEETPHVVVTPAGRAEFRAREGVEARLGGIAGVADVAPVARGRVWLTLRGVAVPCDAVGRRGAKGLVVDPAQAHPLGAFPGDTVTVVSTRSRLSPLGPVPIVSSMKIEDFAPSNAGRRLPEATLPLGDARRLFALGDDGATGYEVKVKDPALAGRVAREIDTIFGASVVTKTWEEANRALVSALKLERSVLFATVFLIVIVAGLNLAATSAVLAATRAGDAAVLSVLGASPRTVASVFLTAGAAVGVVGTLAGIALGAALATLANSLELIPLPGQVYGLAHVPFRVEPLDVVLVAVLSFLWSVAAASFPARAASRQDVAEVLRAA